jgi:hypothetical protein
MHRTRADSGAPFTNMKEIFMRHFFPLVLFCSALLCVALSPAQEPAPSPAPTKAPDDQLKIAPGSVIPVQLTKTIDAKKVKPGDEVVATVTQDMKTKTGDVVVPKDTTVIGHVTESQARSKEQKESEVGIAFDHAVVKGDSMPLPMSIQAVIAPATNSPSNAAANDQESPAMAGGSPAAGAPASPMGAGHSSTGSVGGSVQAQSNYPQPEGGETQAPANPRPVINGMTEGVIGISHLKLDADPQDPVNGSLLSSDKNNVKLDKGTLMLLRVAH